MRRIIGRPDPNQLPSVRMPLYVRSVGYNEAERGWSEFFPADEKQFVQLFWGVEGEGEFLIGGARLTLRRDQVIYHMPGEDHAHTALSSRWAYHWLTLDGPLAIEFMRGYGYPREPMPAGPCPVDLFLRLETLMREMSPGSQRKMLSIATDVLARAGERDGADKGLGRIVGQFMELAQKCHSDPSANVNELADRLGVHRTTLNRLFKKRMLVSPGEYLISLRLQRALSLLRETSLPVCEIGEMVGIPHRGYFCRLVRRAAGVSPAAYRERRSMG